MRRQPYQTGKGFTLAEVLIAVTIFAIVIAISSQFFIDSYATLYKSQTALEANRSSRNFLDVLAEDGMEADSFVIYKDYSGNVKKSLRITNGNSGDFLVLAETELGTLETEYIKLIGYYAQKREVDEYYDVLIFEYDVPSSLKTEPLETLVNKAVSASNNRLLFAQVKRIGSEGMFINVDSGNIFTFHGIRVRFPEQAQPSKILHTTINVRS
ncbi:PulJ/GspJ family protein [Cerasicoccus arenae]|nr:prepilin-type N-terminal cleavage/methylation domain-containing protein [Cerasicoccus arenae]MBK1857398.1 prepilin-type N-terminal cleavage/methylation domain-containing protein [Cerasicoccus arenae]